jgi:hypothetical protein
MCIATTSAVSYLLPQFLASPTRSSDCCLQPVAVRIGTRGVQEHMKPRACLSLGAICLIPHWDFIMRISRVTKVPLVVINVWHGFRGRHWQHHLDLSASLWSLRKSSLGIGSSNVRALFSCLLSENRRCSNRWLVYRTSSLHAQKKDDPKFTTIFPFSFWATIFFREDFEQLLFAAWFHKKMRQVQCLLCRPKEDQMVLCVLRVRCTTRACETRDAAPCVLLLEQLGGTRGRPSGAKKTHG